ncbi:MAG: prolipoprotein diacylglyceryl transferase [Planctomycetes bacterium]|nr:prolipoprotein diacylglyceryl transferase [Planctomycetota bacterium]
MHPILFTIPGLGFPLRSFGLMLAIGFLVGSWILGRLAARYGDDPKNDPERMSRITFWVLVGVVLGARMLYILVEIGQGSEVGHEFTSKPWKMLAVWEGGLVMYGGMFGACALGMWAAKREKMRVLAALDMGLVAGMVGLSIGRVGCFLVGDDYGKIVPEKYQNLPWPITLHVPQNLPDGSLFGPENAGKVLWATENWMSMKALLIAFLGWQLLKRRRYAGQVALVIVLLYAILRGTIEFFRGDTIRGLWFGNTVSTSQIIGIVMALFSIALLVKYRNQRDEPRRA